MSPATDVVVGATDHYARAELVTLGVDGSTPVFLDRRRVELIDEDLPSAPYHHEALEMELGPATELVERVRRSVAKHAREALAAMQSTFKAQALILQASPYPELPASLEAVLRSRPVTYAADGMLYREALADAGAELGLEVHRYPRKSDPAALAAEAMGVELAEVNALVAAFGREAGSPWRKDHKLAAAAALSVIGPGLRG